MRSSTRKAERVLAPLLVLAFILAACSTATGASRSADDHSLDAVERIRAGAFSH
jgi:hypothetical protein